MILSQQMSDHVLPLLRISRGFCLVQSKTQSPFTGLQEPTWSSPFLVLWSHLLPFTTSLPLLQLPWCLHSSCIRVFAPVISSARKTVPSNACITRWRPLLITLYKNGRHYALTPGYLSVCLPIYYHLFPWTLPTPPPHPTPHGHILLSVPRGHGYYLFCALLCPQLLEECLTERSQ